MSQTKAQLIDNLVQPITGALGSASAPTFSFTSDPNTGIYSPGADQLAISTGGSGRLFVDASGNVGFGQASPTSIASYTILSVNNTAGGAVYFQSSGTLKGRIINTSTEFYIGGASGTPLILEAGGSEKLRIDSSGRLLVGTSSSSSNASIVLQGNSGGATGGAVALMQCGLSAASIGVTTTDIGYIWFADNAGGRFAEIKVQSDATAANNDYPGRLVFSTTADGASSPTERMRISSNGSILSALNGTTNKANLVLNVGGPGDPGTSSWITPRIEFVGSALASENTTFIGATGVYNARALVFVTGLDTAGTERMRITHNGNVRVGGTTTINNERFLVVADGTFVGATFYQPLTVSYTAVAFNNPNGIVGSITTSGSSTSYATSSDYRLKENIILIPDGITRLQQLKPSRFNFITDPDHTVDGFIAHEVQTVIPEAITGEKDAVDAEGKPVYQGIDQSKLVPLLTAALQETIGRIETLEATVATLQGQ